MITIGPEESFEATTDAFAPGDVVALRIRDNAGNDVLARTTAGVVLDVTVGDHAVFRRTSVGPDVAGQFTLVWDNGTLVDTEELVVRRAPLAGGEPSGRDLCNVDDVRAYMPQIPDDDDTDAQLQDLISAESDAFLDYTMRQIRVDDDAPATRTYDVDFGTVDERELLIDDATEISSVTIKQPNGDVADADPAYVDMPRNREASEPITSLWFPAKLGTPAQLSDGQTIDVEAEWGWPSIPARVRKAVVVFVARSFVSNLSVLSDSAEDVLPDVKMQLTRDLAAALKVRDALRVPSVG